MRDKCNTFVLMTGLVSALGPATTWAQQPAVPEVAKAVVVDGGAIEVDAGQQWATAVEVPRLADDERPVLSLRAYALAGGGCNYVMQVVLDGAPLSESPLRRRLLNKLPWFDPPNTQYHFSWYDPQRSLWMTMFGQKEPLDFGGTGRDTVFLFDLSGLVAGGQTLRLGFRHTYAGLPAAVRRERAPLVLHDVKLGALKAGEVARLRAAVEGTDEMRAVPVRPEPPLKTKPAEPPYEVVWSGRKESPRAQVAFDDLTGWTAKVSGDREVSLEASVDRKLWRRRLAKLSYSAGKQPATVILRPPAPVLIEEPFDAANLWLFADIERMKERHPLVTAYLEDSSGRDFAIDLGPVKNSYWVLQHGVVSATDLAAVKPPCRFLGLSFFVHPTEAERRLYLESLTFYARNRQPFADYTRPEKPAFPINDDGMLPTPPVETEVRVEQFGQGAAFVSQSDAGTLRVEVDPTRGLFDGIRARWNEGAWFQPMAGGELKLSLAAQGAAGQGEVVSSRLVAGELTVRWRRDIEWQATYSMRGRTLVVDVECQGGDAEGLRFGRVSGLPNARAIEVPYLTYGTGWGPRIACGDEVFVSVLADWYHCECSRIDGATPTTPDGLQLMGGTDYLPLTNGKRNDLRERVLISVSPEFVDVLPNIPHPRSPNMARLSPYMFVMASYLQPTLWQTMKRHGIDHVIACDFARFYVQDFAEGFAGRWRPHPSLTMKQIRQYREGVKKLGYLFGAYSDLRDWFPLNEFFDEDCVSLTSQGDLTDGWYGNFRTKPNYLPVLARLVGQKAHANYPPDSVYMDTHTNVAPIACDYEAGVPGAGIARDQMYFNGDCMLDTQKWYGTVMSEGRVRWMYAGIPDMDYATLSASRLAPEVPPLVDFDLLRIHPLNLGTMMGYGPSAFFGRNSDRLGLIYGDKGAHPAPDEFYQYVSTSLAYGHMLMMGYSYLPPLSRMIQLYAMMQGVQKEYLTDTVAEIRYHDGARFVSTSEALHNDILKLGRVRVRYSKGLTVTVNLNAEQIWRVGEYELPPFGWLIEKPGEILAFSTQIDGRRVDYIRCPEYIYLSAGDKPAKVEAVEAQGAVWLKREANGWRVIPCGNLGPWERFPASNLPAYHRDMRLTDTPTDRGTPHIALDTQKLMGKVPGTVSVKAQDDAAKPVAAKSVAGQQLEIKPHAGVVDYVLR